MLTSHAECYATSGSLHLGLSDHDLIFTVRKNKNSRPKPRFIEFRSMKNFHLPDFLADLKRVPWSSAYTFDNADDVWAHWRTLFKDVFIQVARFCCPKWLVVVFCHFLSWANATSSELLTGWRFFSVDIPCKWRHWYWYHKLLRILVSGSRWLWRIDHFTVVGVVS